MASQSRLRFILILGGLTALGPLSIDMYLPAFTQIAADFGATTAKVELSLATFFAGLSLGQLIYGALSDRFGRKRPLQIGLVFYILFSLGCALAKQVEGLILFRFFQALGACAGMVISRAMVRDLFDARESAKVFSLLMLVMGLAPILAPLVGGFVIAEFHWNALFWIQAGAAVLALSAVSWGLPETRGARPDLRLSKVFASYGEILKDREFLWNALTGGFAQAGMFAYITGSPFVLIEYYGIRPEAYAWVFGSNAAALILASQVNAKLLDRVGPSKILSRVIPVLALCGLSLAAVGFLELPLWGLLVPLFGYMGLMGMVFPNSTANALAHQGQRAGAASALIGTLQFVLASVSAGTVSSLHTGNLIPMTATIAVCAMLSFFSLGRARRHVSARVTYDALKP